MTNVVTVAMCTDDGVDRACIRIAERERIVRPSMSARCTDDPGAIG